MGIGNYIIASRDFQVVDQFLDKEHAYRGPTGVFIRPRVPTNSIALMGSDCSITVECSRCEKSCCAGCDMPFILDLDTDEAVCMECMGTTLWGYLEKYQTGADK